MYLLLGNSHMETGDYESAIQSFEHARTHMRHRTSRTLFVVSLVSVLTGKVQCIESLNVSDRSPDGSLIILESRFNSVCVKPCMHQAAPRMRSSVFTISIVKRRKGPRALSIWNGFLVSGSASRDVLAYATFC